jgi:hypothetical protein
MQKQRAAGRARPACARHPPRGRAARKTGWYSPDRCFQFRQNLHHLGAGLIANDRCTTPVMSAIGSVFQITMSASHPGAITSASSLGPISHPFRLVLATIATMSGIPTSVASCTSNANRRRAYRITTTIRCLVRHPLFPRLAARPISQATTSLHPARSAMSSGICPDQGGGQLRSAPCTSRYCAAASCPS